MIVRSTKQANDEAFIALPCGNQAIAVLFGPQEKPEWDYNTGGGENK